MAKSIRSKWKRKCRAIKRQRYAVKELTRLKKMLGIKEEEKTATEETASDKVMETDQVIFLDAGAIIKEKEKEKKGKKKKKPVTEEPEEDVAMSSDDENVEVDGEDGKKRIFNTKTLKDQNGQYPVWLHKRKIAKINQIGKKKLKKRSKKRKHR